MIFTSGPTVKRLGDVPGKGLSVGYHYQYAGLFWVEFWTWDGFYCVYADGQQPARITEAHAAELLDQEVKDLEKPFAYRFPPGLLLVGVIVLLSVPLRLLRRRSSQRIQAFRAQQAQQRVAES